MSILLLIFFIAFAIIILGWLFDIADIAGFGVIVAFIIGIIIFFTFIFDNVLNKNDMNKITYENIQKRYGEKIKGFKEIKGESSDKLNDRLLKFFQNKTKHIKNNITEVPKQKIVKTEQTDKINHKNTGVVLKYKNNKNEFNIEWE